MDDYTAIGLAEGFVEPTGETEEEQEKHIIQAWQHLIDKGICWQLQGYFGRAAMELIQGGFCTPPEGWELREEGEEEGEEGEENANEN